MVVVLRAVSLDAREPGRLADFWGALLGREVRMDHRDPGAWLVAGAPGQPSLRFLPERVPDPTPRPATGARNRMHWDLTSATPADQEARVALALELGASHLDVGQRGDEGHVVLADPEGNEFDVIGPGNRFLADTGLLGCLASDGTEQVGRFWSRALGWPLVWDQDGETAVQAPTGGVKVSWGGPPVPPKTARGRVRLALGLAQREPALDLRAAMAHLLACGAQQPQADGHGSWELRDPDGNEFELHPWGEGPAGAWE